MLSEELAPDLSLHSPCSDPKTVSFLPSSHLPFPLQRVAWPFPYLGDCQEGCT